MLQTIKKAAHTMFGLYIIGAFITFGLIWLASDAFAQSAWGGWLPFNDPTKTQWLNIWGAWTDTWDDFITIIKNFINYALTFLWFIALVMLLWWGYQMVAAGSDEEAYKEGIKILKNAAIGIAFIAISAFAVNFIFYAIWLVVV